MILTKKLLHTRWDPKIKMNPFYGPTCSKHGPHNVHRWHDGGEWKVSCWTCEIEKGPGARKGK